MSEELVRRFYTALDNTDGETMAACYHDDVVFSDPGFGELRGEDAADMWRMLCHNATDLSVTHEILDATEERATTRWVAHYSFGPKKRPVTNHIEARMRFADGLIIEHHDTFDAWKWAGQALGLPGRVLGWAPPMQSKIRSTARAQLRSFQRRHRS